MPATMRARADLTGTAGRGDQAAGERTAECPRTSSSRELDQAPRPSSITGGAFVVNADQSGDDPVAAQHVQAAPAGGADAAPPAAQRSADLCVRHRRAFDDQRSKSLAVRRQAGERFAERCVPLRDEQFLLRYPCLLVRDVLAVKRVPGSLRTAHGAQGPAAFTLSGGGQPAGQRGWIAEVVEL